MFGKRSALLRAGRDTANVRELDLTAANDVPSDQAEQRSALFSAVWDLSRRHLDPISAESFTLLLEAFDTNSHSVVAAANTVYLGPEPGQLVRNEEHLQAAIAGFQVVNAISDELVRRLHKHPDLAQALTAYRDGLLAWFTEQGVPDISEIRPTAAAYDEVRAEMTGFNICL